MKLAQCIKSIEDKIKEGEFVQFNTASHSEDVILITTKVKNYEHPPEVKAGSGCFIAREDFGLAFGKSLFEKHFKVME